MSIDLKRKIFFVIIELILGITVGLLAVFYSKILSYYTESVILVFLFVYIISIIGIIVPGYFYLKLYGNKEIYVGAIFSSIVWAFFSIFLYIILAFFVGINILLSKEAGLIFPVIFGVIGFNYFAYSIKKYSNM